MRIGRKLLALALVFMMVAGVLPVTASAAEKVAYPVEGGNIYFDPTTGAITDADEGITSAVIPSEIDGVAVTSIGEEAFRACYSLKSVTIPEGVTDIGMGAFYDCTSLTSITIPSSVTVISGSAFSGCTSLASVTIPSSVTIIGAHAFSGCTSLTSVTIPEGVTDIGMAAFYDCTSLTSVTIPSSVTVISWGAFRDCTSLTSIAIPSSVTSIGSDTFYGCDSLTSIVIPSSVTSIGNYAFYGCDSLTSVTMSEGVKRIRDYAFRDCAALTSITIPSSVTVIGDAAFRGCESLSDVYYGGSEEEWNAIDFGDWGNDDLLNATIHYNSPMPEPTPVEPIEPTEPTETADLALANTQTVLVDGESVTFEVYALEVEGGVTNYIKLRDLAYVLNGTAAQFEVSWDGAVNILDGQSYTPNGSEMNTPFSGDREYRPTDAVTKVDGVETPFDAICLTDDDGGEYNYYKLRDLGKALGFDVSWSNEGKYIYIETDQPYTDD